jgi:hypothetical protein
LSLLCLSEALGLLDAAPVLTTGLVDAVPALGGGWEGGLVDAVPALGGGWEGGLVDAVPALGGGGTETAGGLVDAVPALNISGIFALAFGACFPDAVSSSNSSFSETGDACLTVPLLARFYELIQTRR